MAFGARLRSLFTPSPTAEVRYEKQPGEMQGAVGYLEHTKGKRRRDRWLGAGTGLLFGAIATGATGGMAAVPLLLFTAAGAGVAHVHRSFAVRGAAREFRQTAKKTGVLGELHAPSPLFPGQPAGYPVTPAELNANAYRAYTDKHGTILIRKPTLLQRFGDWTAERKRRLLARVPWRPRLPPRGPGIPFRGP